MKKIVMNHIKHRNNGKEMLKGVKQGKRLKRWDF